MNATAAYDPRALDFTLAAELGNDLLTQINALREAEPIAWNDSVNGWIVTRYEDVLDGFAERVPVSCVRFQRCYAHISPEDQARLLPLTTKTVPNWVLNSDPPRHLRLRKLMLPAFSKRVVEGIRPYVRSVVREVLTQAALRDEVEFVNDVARAITGRVIMKLIGIPEANLPRLAQWSWNLNVGFGSARPSIEVLMAAEQSLAEMGALFEEQIAIRRVEPRDDFLSSLIQARDGNDALSTEELIGILYVTLIAGHDTTMNTMTLGLVALVDNPQAVAQLFGAEQNNVGVLMEVMRYVAMSTAFPRIAKQDFEWRSQKIRAGDTIFLMIAGANRDPRVFPDPEAVDVGANPAEKVLSFGSGPHHCIGHLLAKMQLGELFPHLFAKYRVRLLDRKLDFTPVLSQRGLERLRVKIEDKTAAEPQRGTPPP
jgi:pimeloyl-[acyl-carrier protein] synthase